jgi:ubiquinone/menaquinone biosynthesis C-methylase UbiE
MKDRKVLEAEFHDAREFDRLNLSEDEFKSKYSNKKFYVIAKSVRDYQNKLIKSRAIGSKVLDYCCGPGETSLKLANMGYDCVHGIDISAEEISTAKKRLVDSGFESKSSFRVMDAENMTFEDDSFDVIICNGVLHHLDIDEALPELSRVLKPGGMIVAMEALGYNPLIKLYRKMTPHLRTAWETDHILTLSELKKSKKYFNKVNVKYFYLATLMSIPFANTFMFKPMMKITGFIDAILMKIPGIQLMAWQMVFVLENPKSPKN